MLSAWLLLLLEGGASHGYALRRELDARGMRLEPGAEYRVLRSLEREGWLRSEWMGSDVGPRRRRYRLTRKGRRALQQTAQRIIGIRDLHDAFVHVHERARREREPQGAMREERDRSAVTPRGPPRSRAPRAPRPDGELLAAWLLLLLGGGAGYGYELRRDLAAHGASIDPGGLYRRLRGLERDGWIESRWMPAVAGPQRRLYRLTRTGRRNLDDIAALITRMRDAHDAFVRAYEQAHGTPMTGREPGDAVTSA